MPTYLRAGLLGASLGWFLLAFLALSPEGPLVWVNMSSPVTLNYDQLPESTRDLQRKAFFFRYLLIFLKDGFWFGLIPAGLFCAWEKLKSLGAKSRRFYCIAGVIRGSTIAFGTLFLLGFVVGLKLWHPSDILSQASKAFAAGLSCAAFFGSTLIPFGAWLGWIIAIRKFPGTTRIDDRSDTALVQTD